MRCPLTPFTFDVLTLFPDMITQAVSYSILGRAIAAGIISVRVHDIRDHTFDRHRTVDDEPYGGGAGMVMKVEPVVRCIRAVRSLAPTSPVVLMSASGRLFTQADARRYAQGPGLILVCGHYEGVDERVAMYYVDEETSLGDFVLSGGEIPALAIVDAVSRLVPGVLGNRASLVEESHEDGLLEYPQFTRPAVFEGHAVPEVRLSGKHAEVARWRREAAREKTRRMRPDLPCPPEERPLQLGRPRDE